MKHRQVALSLALVLLTVAERAYIIAAPHH